MKEVQAMKDIAQEEMERQKDEYEQKLVELETQMVRVWRGGVSGRGEEVRGYAHPQQLKFLVYSSSLPPNNFLISSSCSLSPPPLY